MFCIFKDADEKPASIDSSSPNPKPEGNEAEKA